jgi:atypical dual specificity phosphatase
MALTLADWQCAGDVRPRPHAHSYWLADGAVLAGRHPGLGGAAWLPAAGITHVVDLTAPGEPVDRYDSAPVRWLRHPITDFGVPTLDGMAATLTDVAAALEGGGRVYLHCRAGIGRTGTVAACLLVEQGLSAGEALALLARKFAVTAQHALGAESPEMPQQRAFVARWAQHRGR